jgi:REP element-mobilizing transposase RayT
MNRAARRKTIFRNDSDCILFLDTLGDTARRFHLEVHAYSLMPNHYHLLLRSTEGNLSRAMRHLNSIFTQRLNRANGWDGPVFRGRFASRLIHDETYLNCVLAYIHLNPLKANLITRLDADRSWTSHRAYLEKDTPPEWLHLDVMLARFGGKEALHETILGLHRGKLAWPEIGFSSETGFPAAVTFTRAERRSLGKENTPTVDERHALLAKICDITGVSLPRLKKRILGPRGNPERRFAVWALARSTTLTQREIGALLGMSAAHVAKDLARKRVDFTKFDAWVDAWNTYMSTGMV